MASATRTQAACLTAAGKALLEANFHPDRRMGFDAHVQAWRKVTGTRALLAYARVPAFRAAVLERRAQIARELAA